MPVEVDDELEKYAAKPKEDDDLEKYAAKQPSAQTVPQGSPSASADARPWYRRAAETAEKWWKTPTQDVNPNPALSSEEAAMPYSTSPQTAFHRGSKILAAEGGPSLVSGVIAAPLATGLALGGGLFGTYAGEKAGGYVGEKVGAPELGSDIGGTTGGLFGAKLGSEIPGLRTRLGRIVRDPLTGKVRSPYQVAVDKILPDPDAVTRAEAQARPINERMTEKQHAEFAKQQSEVEAARQKELADMERLKEQDAQSRMRRGAQQGRLDKAHEQRLADTEAARQRELAANERFKEQHAQSLMRRGADQESLDTQAESIGTKIYPEPREPLPGDRPGAMWSVGREDVLPGAAQRGTPGAGDVLRNIGEPIIYTPREGVGYPGPSPRFSESVSESPAPQGQPPQGLNLAKSDFSDIPAQPISPLELEEASRQAGRPISADEFPSWRRAHEAERNISEGLRGNRKDTAGEIREKHRAKLEKKGQR